MSANSGELSELQAFLNAHPRRRYRQGIGLIPLQAIRAGSTPTRSECEPELLQELADSIKVTGVIQPLIVRPVPGFPHQFAVVAGERRLRARAARRLGGSSGNHPRLQRSGGTRRVADRERAARRVGSCG